MIPIADQKILQIDITSACPHTCSNCTRFSAHYRRHFFMDFDQFRQAVDSVLDYPGMIGIMGGEPTIHPEFERFVEYYAERIDPGHRSSKGRHPIEDFSAHRHSCLSDIGVKRGLWTSLGPGYYRHYELIQEVFDYQCINDHTNDGLHQAILVASQELPFSTEERRRLQDNCWINRLWSSTITPKGAFFCEVAGALDMLLGGPGGWPVEPGWWRRPVSEWEEQRHWCDLCGAAMPVPRRRANDQVDDITPGMVERLEQRGSPRVRKQHFMKFDPEGYQSERYADEPNAEWYLPADATRARVSPTNRSLHPHKLDCVMVCINYADYLARTLPYNRGHFDELIVVTADYDAATQDVCRRYGVEAVVSDRIHDDSAVFNKGRALNDGIAALREPDWILLTDADILFPIDLRRRIDELVLNPGLLYYTRRKHIDLTHLDKIDTDLTGVLSGQYTALTTKRARVRRGRRSRRVLRQRPHQEIKPFGYFQLFNVRAQALRGLSTINPEHHQTAEHVDNEFRKYWTEDRRIALPLPQFDVAHVPHGKRENWKGRKSASILPSMVRLARPREDGRWQTVFRGSCPWLWNTGLELDEDNWGCKIRDQPLVIRFATCDGRHESEFKLERGIHSRQRIAQDRTWIGRPWLQFNAVHLGVTIDSLIPLEPAVSSGTVIIDARPIGKAEFTGFGFGHRMYIDDRQALSWEGVEIEGGFEIAIHPL